MAAKGTFTARVFTSNAQIPIPDAFVTITQNNGTRLLAARFSDRSGNIPPVTISTPDRAQSEAPGFAAPYTLVDVLVQHPGYERILVENVQLFAGVITQQNFELIPLPERPEYWNMTEVFELSRQEL